MTYFWNELVRLFWIVYEETGVIGAICYVYFALCMAVLAVTIVLDLILLIYYIGRSVKSSRAEKLYEEKWRREHPDCVMLSINERAFTDIGGNYNSALLTVYSVNGERPVRECQSVLLPVGRVTLRAGRRRAEPRSFRYHTKATFRDIIRHYQKMIKGYKEMLGIIKVREEEEKSLSYGVPVEFDVIKGRQYEIKVDAYDNEIHIVMVDERDRPTVIEVPADAGFETITEQDRRQKFRPGFR